MLREIETELKRLAASDVAVSLDDEFAPTVGTLIQVQHDGAQWRLLPGEFLGLLLDLPSGAGDAAVRKQIEKQGQFVWHGPSPSGGRDNNEPSPPEKDG